ncbi:MAG: DUF3806 domain-containing protein [Halioglobus sp.]|nr:DUF3806 domain-containing protein [Halioglobus sp.]
MLPGQWITLAFLSAFCLIANAQQEPRIDELSVMDRRFMEQQRDLVQDIAERHLGRSLSGERERDIAVLQKILDERLVRPDQTRELQAMGVILGDLLAVELDMHWVIYEDKVGRSRALRYRATDNYLFPVTMISRRREAGSDTPVAEIYRKAYDIIDRVRPPQPFSD